MWWQADAGHSIVCMICIHQTNMDDLGGLLKGIATVLKELWGSHGGA